MNRTRPRKNHPPLEARRILVRPSSSSSSLGGKPKKLALHPNAQLFWDELKRPYAIMKWSDEDAGGEKRLSKEERDLAWDARTSPGLPWWEFYDQHFQWKKDEAIDGW